jgi:phage terminase large subunit-like protein
MSRSRETRGQQNTSHRSGYKLGLYFPDCTTECKNVSRATFRKLKGAVATLAWYPVGSPIPSPVKEDHKNLDGTQRYCRALYPKHVYLMQAGSRYRERCIMAANRIGKSELGAYEATLHLTGLYPPWWRGRRFSEAVSWWCAGDTGKTARNIIQLKLLGPPTAIGTGFIPAHLLVHKTKKSGVPDAYETFWVKHASGGISHCELKSYDQRREAFQGTAQHGIWLDEEPPMDIYTECLLRTARTSDFPGGIIVMTYTPLKGRTGLVKEWMKNADRPDIYVEPEEE